jgi:hypothetical protein
MMISVEDMAEDGEFIAAVAPTAPVITVPRLTTVAMAEETLEKSCIVPAAAAPAVLHGDGGGRTAYNPRRNVRNLGHAKGRPDDVSVGATKPPALEEAAEEEEEEEEKEEEDLLGNLWTEMQEQCSLAGPTTLMLMVQYLTGLIVISFVGLLGAQDLAAISLTNCFVGITGFDVLVRMGHVCFFQVPPHRQTDRERRQQDLGLLLDSTDQAMIITLHWDFFCSKD